MLGPLARAGVAYHTTLALCGHAYEGRAELQAYRRSASAEQNTTPFGTSANNAENIGQD